jgi:predicted secreted protein
MTKAKKVIILSHCILNEYSKVNKWDKDEKITELNTMDFLKFLLDNEIGIIQLPCPELKGYGLKRWGQVKEQYDHPHYRKICRELFEPILDQILEYQSNGFEIISLMGIYGSPTCGIYRTCSGNWGGEIGSNPDIQGTIATVTGIDDSGILMEEINQIFKANNLDIPMIDFHKENLVSIIDQIKKSL